MKQRIEKTLTENLKPEFLEVKDNSNFHIGHLEQDGRGETHFMVSILSEELKKISKIEAHRKVNHLLKDDFKNGLHALEIKILHKKH